MKTVNTIAYQLDKSFTRSMQLNSKQSDIQTHTREQTRLESTRAVRMNLLPFAANTLTYTSKSQPEVKAITAEAKLYQDSTNQLKNLEASDSIFSRVQGIEIAAFFTKKNIGLPGRNDDAFNFSALVEPEAYTEEQSKNSQNFIGIATRQYQNYADGINLNELKSGLVKYQKQGPKVLAQQIDQFRNNDAYKKYQMAVRSITANKSVSTDILAGLAAERKPIVTTQADPQLDAISRAIGVEPKTVSLKNDAGETVTMFQYASPMQIAKFRANYRLNNPKWYQEVATDSAENLQRKSVVLLAEISSQLYQNHLDSEKIMGALAMNNLQGLDMTNQMLQLQVKDVNAAISAFSASSNQDNSPEPLKPADTANSSTIDPNDPSTYNQAGTTPTNMTN